VCGLVLDFLYRLAGLGDVRVGPLDSLPSDGDMESLERIRCGPPLRARTDP